MKGPLLLLAFALATVLSGCGWGHAPAGIASGGIRPHICSWGSANITNAATCTSEGTQTMLCEICRDIRTEVIPRTEHQYITFSEASSCEVQGQAYQVCAVCGKLEEQEGVRAPGHSYEKVYVLEEPGCRGPVSYSMICSVCGHLGSSGTEPARPHTPEEISRQQGDCLTPTVIEYACNVCGAFCGRDSFLEQEHHWVEKETDPCWSEEQACFVTNIVLRCSRCNAAP